MQHFKNILLISYKSDTGIDTLKRALNLAYFHKVSLKVLVVAPKFPDKFKETQVDFETQLLEKINTQIQRAFSDLKFQQSDVKLSIMVESGDKPVTRIIQSVLRDAHDLVIKQADERLEGSGFKALDMDLLRKCPCPVFLNRENTVPTEKIRIAVAVDVESPDAIGRDLAIQLLKLASEISAAYNAELSIISSWFFEYEYEFEKGARFEISADSLQEILKGIKDEHQAKFDAVIRDANLDCTYKTYSIKGDPDESIPSFIMDNSVDILVIGTVARAGIEGVLVGNTAENILQLITCSLVAKKPNGFISPIKAY